MSEWSASVADVTDAAKAGAGNKAVETDDTAGTKSDQN